MKKFWIGLAASGMISAAIIAAIVAARKIDVGEWDMDWDAAIR